MKALGSSLRCAQSAARVKAIVGHYLLHPLYLSTYHIEHVLELNDYMKWVLNLLDVLILDPTPLLEGDVHALQYFHRALQHEPLLTHALHTPAWGDAAFLRMPTRLNPLPLPSQTHQMTSHPAHPRMSPSEV